MDRARINVFSYDEERGATYAGWFDLNSAVEIVGEDTDWDGNDFVSVQPIPKFHHQRLIRTAKGRWVLNHWTQYQGSPDEYAFVSDERAHEWLMVNHSDDMVEKYFGDPEPESGPEPADQHGKPINWRPGDLLPEVDGEAARGGVSRAEMLRVLVGEALESRRAARRSASARK